MRIPQSYVEDRQRSDNGGFQKSNQLGSVPLWLCLLLPKRVSDACTAADGLSLAGSYVYPGIPSHDLKPKRFSVLSYGSLPQSHRPSRLAIQRAQAGTRAQRQGGDKTGLSAHDGAGIQGRGEESVTTVPSYRPIGLVLLVLLVLPGGSKKNLSLYLDPH